MTATLTTHAPTLCTCGSPIEHLQLDEDAPGWGCRVPAFHPTTGLLLSAVCTDTSGRQHRRCQSTDAAGAAQCVSPAGHTEPAGEPSHIGRTGAGRLAVW